MLIELLKKEIKVFFTNKGNLLFMIFMPIAFVAIFSVCLKDYMNADFNTFDNAVVFYYQEQAGEAVIEQFEQLSAKIEEATGAEFIQKYDFDEAIEAVEQSEGVAVITLSQTGLSYYRSPYNETNAGKIIRSLFEQLTDAPMSENNYIQSITLEASSLDSNVYYTFAGLSFTLLYMALLVANSTFDERRFKTIERIKISKAGIGNMLLSKILTGLLCGIVSIFIVYLFSRLVLGITWGSMTVLMLSLFILLSIFGTVMGSVLGMICKSNAMCQNIVLIANIIFGLLGGAFLPLTLLERIPFINALVRLSPLYWTNRALASLYNGIIDNHTYYSVGVLAGLSLLLLLFYYVVGCRPLKTKKTKHSYEGGRKDV